MANLSCLATLSEYNMNVVEYNMLTEDFVDNYVTVYKYIQQWCPKDRPELLRGQTTDFKNRTWISSVRKAQHAATIASQ